MDDAFKFEPGDKLESGGSGAEAGQAWIWVKTGYHNGDPEQPDSRVGAADPEAAAEIVRRWNVHADLLAALEDMTSKWVDMANSGDAGFWDPEKEPSVIAARAAIAKARGQ